MAQVFAFDVESIGLHGEAFAVAGGVYSPAGAVGEEFCSARGFNPLQPPVRSGLEVEEHDPLCDARYAARLWFECLSE